MRRTGDDLGSTSIFWNLRDIFWLVEERKASWVFEDSPMLFLDMRWFQHDLIKLPLQRKWWVWKKNTIRYFLGMGKFPYEGDHEKTWGGFAEPPTAGWKDYGPSLLPLTMKPPQQSSFFLVIPSHESGFPALTTVKNRTAPYCWHGSEIRRKKKHTTFVG